ncbi:hypothetical protein AFE_0904 [Acidithiobacillus ferrooxidans ATCC 23270]|uniref:Uncharacterized protein n=1 Tax=Acidithiobacillus ferrooxidans (strain ATCC 23270 / DSM 14882 / CIP 104768 / NCIMB 8455) TaxID=243159 RepID=B7J784_ACIF2|nr:hypothetical protein AFE_0904 [Acidithiobacillus ferrooxidans ATCC 23270]
MTGHHKIKKASGRLTLQKSLSLTPPQLPIFPIST